MRAREIRIVIVAVLSLLAMTASSLARAQAKQKAIHSVTESIEWTWAQRPEKIDPKLPNVLLLGDSLSRGYYPEVARELAGKANCYLFATSASVADPRFAGQLRSYFRMVPVRFDVIHFNNGMHGWGYTEKQYARGLAEAVSDLRAVAPGARLIWASTTPVLDPAKADGSTSTGPHRALGPHGNGATNDRIEARNAIARKIMLTSKIPIDDQFTLMRAHANLHQGAVHYTVAGSTIQAEQVVKSIVPLLRR